MSIVSEKTLSSKSAFAQMRYFRTSSLSDSDSHGALPKLSQASVSSTPASPWLGDNCFVGFLDGNLAAAEEGHGDGDPEGQLSADLF